MCLWWVFVFVRVVGACGVCVCVVVVCVVCVCGDECVCLVCVWWV